MVTTVSQASNVLTSATTVRPIVSSANNLAFAHSPTVVTGLHRATTPSTRMPTMMVVGPKGATLQSAHSVASTISSVSSAHATVTSASGSATITPTKDKRNYSTTMKSVAEGYVVRWRSLKTFKKTYVMSIFLSVNVS